MRKSSLAVLPAAAGGGRGGGDGGDGVHRALREAIRKLQEARRGLIEEIRRECEANPVLSDVESLD